jgi:hypothetical protein
MLRYADKVEAPFGTCGGINDRPGKDLCFDMHHRVGSRKIVEETHEALSLGLVTDLMMHVAFDFTDEETMVVTGELAHVSLSSI